MAGGPENPFSSGGFSNPFSASSGGQPAPASPAQETKESPFRPNPHPTNRGSFEAMFSGQPGGRTATISLRELVPYLPPSLVSLGDLPLDRSFEIPLSGNGDLEVKLSTIQTVCPEVFATEITPLNDSEITLPFGDSNQAPVKSAATPAATDTMRPQETTISQPIEKESAAAEDVPVTAKRGIFSSLFSGGSKSAQSSGEDEPISAGVTNSASSPVSASGGGNARPQPASGLPPVASNPFSAGEASVAARSKSGGAGENPFAAGLSAEVEERKGFVNPFASPSPSFASPADESKETPEAAPTAWSQPTPEAKVAVESDKVFGGPAIPENRVEPKHQAEPVESKGSAFGEKTAPSPFGFPAAKDEGSSLFGAFGTPPQPVSQPEKPAESFPSVAKESAWTEFSKKSVEEPLEPKGLEKTAPVAESLPEPAPAPEPAEESTSAQAPSWNIPSLDPAPAKSQPAPVDSPWSGSLFGNGGNAVSSEDDNPFAGPISATPEKVQQTSSPAPVSEAVSVEEPVKDQAERTGLTDFDTFFSRHLETESEPEEDSPFEPPSKAATAREVAPTPAPAAAPEESVVPIWSGSFPSSIFGNLASKPKAEEPAPEPKSTPRETAPVSPWDSAPAAEEPVSAPSAPEPDPIPVSAPATPAASPDQVVFSLRDILIPMTQKTGINFSNIPPVAKVRLPVSLIEPQLATGEVSLRVIDLARYTDLESAELLKRIDPMLSIPLPQNELFHQLQDIAPELLPESDMDLETEFTTLFASEADSDSGLTWLSPPKVTDESVVAPWETAPVAAPTSNPQPEPEAQPEAKPEAEQAPQPKVEEPKEQEAMAAAAPAPKRVISVTRTSQASPSPAQKPAAEIAKAPVAAIEKSAGPTIIDTIIPTSKPVVTASAAPKAPQSQPAPKVAKEDPFASFNILGPLPVDDELTSDPVQPQPDTVEPKPASPTSSFPSSDWPDPFAPLPRKSPPRAAEPTPVAEDREEEEGDTFFDDLNHFSGATQEVKKETKPEPEAETPAASRSKEIKDVPKREKEMPTGFTSFASFDDLEPFSPSTTMEWPGNALPKKSIEKAPEKEADAPAPVAAAPEPEPVATPAPEPTPTRTVAPTTPLSTGGNFFEELTADTLEEIPSQAAVQSPASSVPATLTTPVVPSPVPTKNLEMGIRDIELRAVFGTNEPFTYKRVADLAASLPGVEACALIGPDMAVQAPRGRESGDLANQAGALMNSARELARFTGVANAETFTLHTERGIVSVFVHGDCCLTVRHSEGQFDPGVREKLILVSRGLSGLES